MRKNAFFAVLVLAMLAASGCVMQTAPDSAAEKPYSGKKALFINSYHEGYEWSDAVQNGAEEVFNQTGVELRIYYMDTKNNPSEEFIKQAALEAKSIIEEFGPDVVITADDNAFKFVIMEYYRDADLPVVFCGLNWDASVYGAPYKNTAGMVEVALIKQMVEHMSEYAKGNKVGFITADVLSEHKNAEYFDKYVEGGLSKEVFVNNFSDWKDEYLKLQEEVDMLILGVSAGIQNWSDEEAEAFVLENIKIPTGVEARWMMPFALIGLTKVPEEQGEYAAETALRIIDGENPSDIPVEENKKGSLMLNLKTAKKLDVGFSAEMLRTAAEIMREE